MTNEPQEVSLSKIEPLTDDEIENIRKRCDGAHPGPWGSYWEGRDHWGGGSFLMLGEGDQRGKDIEVAGIAMADQDFIAHARQDIPKLLNEIERLKRLLKDRNGAP
jgi:hypothetical protein